MKVEIIVVASSMLLRRYSFEDTEDYSFTSQKHVLKQYKDSFEPQGIPFFFKSANAFSDLVQDIKLYALLKSVRRDIFTKVGAYYTWFVKN